MSIILVIWRSLSQWNKSDRTLKMSKETKNSENIGSSIAMSTAIGATIFALTNDPVWIGVCVALGAAIGSARADSNKEKS
jgi:hypothetical protein